MNACEIALRCATIATSRKMSASCLQRSRTGLPRLRRARKRSSGTRRRRRQRRRWRRRQRRPRPSPNRRRITKKRRPLTLGRRRAGCSFVVLLRLAKHQIARTVFLPSGRCSLAAAVAGSVGRKLPVVDPAAGHEPGLRPPPRHLRPQCRRLLRHFDASGKPNSNNSKS